MSHAQDYALAHANRFRKELHDLLRIPSVSTDPAFASEVRRAAAWLADHLAEMGLTTELIETERHPLVYAEWLAAEADAPTILIYGHYDVQPAVLADGWATEPFDPVEKDGKLYARGATDDKGQFFTHVKAVEALLKAEGTLPVNVKFILEGEEESGSGSIRHFLDEHPERLQADVCVISDTSMSHIDQPEIVSALRGGIALELHVTGPRQDLHSGMYGGTVHNPAQALAEILSKLHLADHSVAVPGFYDDVLLLSDDERTEIAQLPWTEADWREETGAPAPWGEADYSLRERIGARPTLEICGMTGGYAGDGFKSIIPGKAIAKISCRLVANQEPIRIFEAVSAYIASITPPTVQSEVIFMRGAPAAQVDITHPVMQAAVAAYEQGWGAQPVFVREGGSIPIVAGFQAQLNLPVILMGFGLNTDNLHGPNEHFSVEMFHRGVATSIAFLRALEMHGIK
jgi:acetylornithine deacetylase/succinyl-diaminopimelate desuccinylase-like protein